MCVGLAPCEIASVATTAMAKGEPALSAGVLMGSTFATIVIAGPVLALESSSSSVHPTHILVNLTLVVALPLVAGLLLRAFVPLSQPTERLAMGTATVAVAALVALVRGRDSLLGSATLPSPARFSSFWPAPHHLGGSSDVGRPRRQLLPSC